MRTAWLANNQIPTATFLIGLLVIVLGAYESTKLASKPPSGKWTEQLRRQFRRMVVLGLLVSLGTSVAVPGQLTSLEKSVVEVGLVLGVLGVAEVASAWITPKKKSGLTILISVLGIAVVLLIAGQEVNSVLHPRPAPATTYPLYGIRAAGAKGLYQRAGPGTAFAKVGRELHDGDRVPVICLAHGNSLPGYRNHTWDEIAPHTFISSIFVDQPRGGAPPYIPACEED